MPHRHRTANRHNHELPATRVKRAASSPYPRVSSPEAGQAHDEIREKLRALHADEIAYLSQGWKRSNVPKVVSQSYGYLFWRTNRRFFHYLWQTWTRALWSTLFLPTSEYAERFQIDPADRNVFFSVLRQIVYYRICFRVFLDRILPSHLVFGRQSPVHCEIIRLLVCEASKWSKHDQCLYVNYLFF